MRHHDTVREQDAERIALDIFQQAETGERITLGLRDIRYIPLDESGVTFQRMTALLVIAIAIVAVVVAGGVVVLVIVLREAWPSRGEWAEEDRAAGEDPRRGVADKGFWAGPSGLLGDSRTRQLRREGPFV